MAWMQLLILLGAGATAGFVAGLIGVGGGVIFTPVLLVYLQQMGTDPVLLPKLTIGSSLVSPHGPVPATSAARALWICARRGGSACRVRSACY